MMHPDSSPDSRSTAGRILRRGLVLLVRAVLVLVLLAVLLAVLLMNLGGEEGCGCDPNPTIATPLAGQENVLESPERQAGRDHGDVRAGVADSGAEDWRQTHAQVVVTLM